MSKFARYIVVLDRPLDDVGEQEHDGTGSGAAWQLVEELRDASLASVSAKYVITGRTIMDTETAPTLGSLHTAYEDNPNASEEQLVDIVEIDGLTGYERTMGMHVGITRDKAEADIDWKTKNIAYRYSYRIVPTGTGPKER